MHNPNFPEWSKYLKKTEDFQATFQLDQSKILINDQIMGGDLELYLAYQTNKHMQGVLGKCYETK